MCASPYGSDVRRPVRPRPIPALGVAQDHSLPQPGGKGASDTVGRLLARDDQQAGPRIARPRRGDDQGACALGNRQVRVLARSKRCGQGRELWGKEELGRDAIYEHQLPAAPLNERIHHPTRVLEGIRFRLPRPVVRSLAWHIHTCLVIAQKQVLQGDHHHVGVAQEAFVGETLRKHQGLTQLFRIVLVKAELVSNYVDPNKHIMLHSENGFVGLDSSLKQGTETERNKMIIDAGGMPSSIILGGQFFDSSISFGLIRGGHIDVTVLGALQVDKDGNLANYMIPGKMIPGMGGAMDLVSGAKKVTVSFFKYMGKTFLYLVG